MAVEIQNTNLFFLGSDANVELPGTSIMVVLNVNCCTGTMAQKLNEEI